MKTIIHPTDFSDNASKTLEFAIDFSKKFDAELLILNVEGFPTMLSSSSSLTSFSAMEDEKRTGMIAQLKSYAANYIDKADLNLKIQFMAKLNSSTAKGILEAIDETGADMVVVGTKGQSKLKKLIVGSTTKALVTSAPCPVLAIPEDNIFGKIKQIVYASDFDSNDISAIKRVVPVSQTYHAKISVLHIFKKLSEEGSEALAFQKQLTDEVKYMHLRYDTLVSDDVASSLINYLKLTQADLLVMFEKETTGINGLFQKNMATEFMLQTTIPLMTYNIHSVHTLKEV